MAIWLLPSRRDGDRRPGISNVCLRTLGEHAADLAKCLPRGLTTPNGGSAIAAARRLPLHEFEVRANDVRWIGWSVTLNMVRKMRAVPDDHVMMRYRSAAIISRRNKIAGARNSTPVRPARFRGPAHWAH